LWTLKIEVSFYLLIPILLFFAKRTDKKIALFTIVYLFSIIYRNSFEYISEITQNPIYTMLARQLPGFLSYFVSGIACYYFFEYFMKYKIYISIGAVIIFLIERRFGLEILTPIALSAIVFTIAFSLKRLNTFGKFGDISYGIYIFHCPIIKTITYFGFFNKYNPFIVGLLTIIIILLTGFASWYYIEKGFLKKSHSICIHKNQQSTNN
jgi:peptidoglycan/LPS O-acetylase OafA/YrhL